MTKIKLFPGLVSLLQTANERKSRIESAEVNLGSDPVAEMAKQMHPEELRLAITNIRDESKTVRTFRMVSEQGTMLPIFQPGQYISIKMYIGDSSVSRAYTISSAPYEADGKNGFYEISIRHKENGFVSPAIWDQWKIGTQIMATGPHGEFYVSPLRDTNEIVAIAGGTGITPFRSMIKQFAHEGNQISLTLLYGCVDINDVLFQDELEAVVNKAPERFKRINTFEDCGGDPGLHKGFINADFIKSNVENPGNKTFFICGPHAMYRFLRREFPKIGDLERKQMRYEVSGAPDDVTQYPGFDSAVAGKSFTAKVIMDDKMYEIPALATEPLLVAVEKAGLILESRCRSGECGICRSKLDGGRVFILPDNDGRRAADCDLGYIHPCATYPMSDVKIIIPAGKPTQT